MSKVIVRTRCGEFTGDLDGSDISNAIWLSNSISFDINMLGGMLYGELPLDAILPWDHIDVGVRKAHLLRERERAYRAELSPDCRKQCSACGAAGLLKEGRCDG